MSSTGTGAVFCVPALGSAAKEYISKLGRVYLTTLSKDGDNWINLGVKLQNFIQEIKKSDMNPDVILIDSRSGLNDLSATALTQLDAEIMLFARDEPQSWENYAFLFEYLSKSKQVEFGRQSEDLRNRLKMVAAQIGSTEEELKHCINASFEVWSNFYDEETASEQSDISYALNDEAAPHYPTPVYFADALRGFTGWGMGHTPQDDVITLAFGKLCDLWATRLDLLS